MYVIDTKVVYITLLPYYPITQTRLQPSCFTIAELMLANSDESECDVAEK